MKKKFTAALMVLILCLTIISPAFSQERFPQNQKRIDEAQRNLRGNKIQGIEDKNELENFFFQKPKAPSAPKPVETPSQPSQALQPAQQNQANKKEEISKNPPPKPKKFLEVLTVKRVLTFSDMFEQLTPMQLVMAGAITGFLLDYDRMINSSALQSMNTDFWNKWSPKITNLGDGAVDVIIAALPYLKGTPRDRLVAQMGVEAITLTGLQVQYLKHIFGVPRPAYEGPQHLGPSVQHDAMPSGHAATAWAVATVIGEAYNLKWLTYPLAALVGLTRLKEQAHWASDVFVGSLLGNLAAKEVMSFHGFINPKRYHGNNIDEDTTFLIEGSLSKAFDNNVLFDNANLQSDSYGILELRGNIAHKFGSSDMVQLTYEYDREIFNKTSSNNLEDKYLSLRYSHKFSPRLAAHLGYRLRVISLPDVALFNTGNYSNNYKDKTWELGLTYKITPVYWGKAAYQVQEKIYPGFEFTGGNSNLYNVGLFNTPKGKNPLYLQLAYQYENFSAVSPAFSYRNSSFLASLDKKFSSRSDFSLFYNTQAKKFLNQAAPDGTLRRDSWKAVGIQFRQSFGGDWNVELSYARKLSTSTDPAWQWGKNVYSIGINNKF